MKRHQNILKNLGISACFAIAQVAETAQAQCPNIIDLPNGLTAVGKDMRTADTQPWCDPVCTQVTANGTSCKNAAGQNVTTLGVCNDIIQSIEAIKDIEYNMCIDIDDRFVQEAGYNGRPPGTNYQISTVDAAFYFSVLFSEDSNRNGLIDGAEVISAHDRGWQLTNELNLNGDDTITRAEAGASKGASPCQLLSTGFSSGLATDDILSYIGLYLGDPVIDKYAGNLEGEDAVKKKLLEFSRTWQPSYWKNNNRPLGVQPSLVHSYWNNEYNNSFSRRVCDFNYNGAYKQLYSMIKENKSVFNASYSSVKPTPNVTNKSVSPHAGFDQHLNSQCNTSSHPYWCSSMAACFNEKQMQSYCEKSNSKLK